MRLVISQFISLGGVVQAPGGPDEDTSGGFAHGGFAHGGWAMPYFDPEVMGGFLDEAMQQAEALLFGRRTWQTMAAAWPDRDDDGDPFATRMNGIANDVVSSTLTQHDLHWNDSTPVRGTTPQWELADRYGLSWRICPGELGRLLDEAEPERAERAMRAVLGMVRIDIAAVRAAADG